MNYAIHETFLTFQGEGVHLGRKAFFIRTMGCPVKCPWCDSAGTWHPKWLPKQKSLIDELVLVDKVLVADPCFVVVTGGEPALWDWNPFLIQLRRSVSCPPPVHLETSGHLPIVGDFDWVTLSPKKWGLPCKEAVALADEFKIIVETLEDIPVYLRILEDAGGIGPRPVWLHPEWSRRNDPALLQIISSYVKTDKQLRAGYQMHKLYQVDRLDPNSAIPVPLGGDATKGF